MTPTKRSSTRPAAKTVDLSQLTPAEQKKLRDQLAALGAPPAAAAVDQLLGTTEPVPVDPAAADHPFTVGQVVRFATVDPLTNTEMRGVGVVAGTYTFGEGDETKHNVAVAALAPDLYLDVADVTALGDA